MMIQEEEQEAFIYNTTLHKQTVYQHQQHLVCLFWPSKDESCSLLLSITDSY